MNDKKIDKQILKTFGELKLLSFKANKDIHHFRFFVSKRNEEDVNKLRKFVLDISDINNTCKKYIQARICNGIGIAEELIKTKKEFNQEHPLIKELKQNIVVRIDIEDKDFNNIKFYDLLNREIEPANNSTHKKLFKDNPMCNILLSFSCEDNKPSLIISAIKSNKTYPIEHIDDKPQDYC